MKRWSLAVIWLVVLGTATVLTWQIVSAAAAQVNDPPVAPLNVAAPSIALQSTTTLQTTTTLPEPTVPTTVGSTTSTTVDSQTTTTSSSQPSSSTTTTTAPESWKTKTVQTQGGTLILVYRAGEVAYQSGTPAPGYHIDVDNPGPPEVEVELESEEYKIEIHASWHDGELEISVSGEHED